MIATKDSTFEERTKAPRVEEIACEKFYKSQKCIIEKWGWDLLHKNNRGKFMHHMPDLISDTPDFWATTHDYKLQIMVEAKQIKAHGICFAMKVTHWEAYKKWFKLMGELADFYFFFYNKSYGSINAPFHAVKNIIDNDSEIDTIDTGEYNEKKIHRFSVRGLEEYNVKRF